MMKKLVALLSILLISGLTIQSYAQDYDPYDDVDDENENVLTNRTGFGFHLGHYQAEDAENGSLFFGAQMRARGNILGAELSAEYRGEQEYSVTGGEFTVRQVPVTGSLLLFAPIGEAFAPYALAGLGAYYTIYDYEDDFADVGDDSEVNFGYHLGLGTDIAISDNAALNIDYRYLFLDGNQDSIDNSEFSGNVFTAGLTFYF